MEPPAMRRGILTVSSNSPTLGYPHIHGADGKGWQIAADRECDKHEDICLLTLWDKSIVKDKMVIIVSVFIFVLIVILAGISSDWGISLLTRYFK